MRRIVFTYHTGYCGMDSHDFQVYPDDITEDELDQDAWEGAVSNAESYGIYPYPDEYDTDENDEELDSEDYSLNIEGYWEDFDPEKHKGLGIGIGSTVTKIFKDLEERYNK